MLKHIVTDLHEVYLREFEAQLGKTATKPQLGSKKPQQSSSGGGEESGSDDKIKKQARQLAYDTRYKARREDIPLERAWSQVLQNSSASAPVKELAKGMVFGGGVKKEEYDLEEGEDKKQMVLVTPSKGFGKPYRRYATRSKIHQLRSNPQIQSVTGTSYGTPYEGEKKKGEQTAAALQHKPSTKKSKKDYDGDGKIESGSKEHAGAVHNAIQRATGGTPDGQDTRKKKMRSESLEEFSDWRTDLSEIVTNLKKEKERKISEKSINNQIKINPDLKETLQNIGAESLSIQEINEEYLNETINIATECFYNNGLNEFGIDILIEELGLESFVDFVFEIFEDYSLFEARTLTGKKKNPATGKERGISLKASPGKTTKAAVEKHGTTRRLSSSSSSTIRKKSVAVKKAVEKQPESKSSPQKTKTGIAGKVGSALGSIVKRGKEDIKRVQDAAQTARNVAARRGAEVKAVYDVVRAKGKEAEKSASATRARRKATVAAGRTAQAAGKAAIKTAGAAGAATGAAVKAKKQGKSNAAAAGAAAGKFVKKLTSGYELEGNLVDEDLHPSVKRIDAINAQKVKDRAAAAAKEQSQKAASTAKFQQFKKDHIAGGGTPVSALDAWQRRKLQKAHFEPEGSSVEEAKKMKGEDPCWKGYQMVGTKKKGGKEVPNCVPKEAVNPYAVGMAAAMKSTGDKPPLKKSTINKAHKIAKKVEAKEELEIDEAISTVTGQQGNQVAGKQQDTEQKQTKNAQAKLNKILMARKNLQMAQQQAVRSGVTNIGSSFEMDGELVDEKTRYAKETGINFRKQKPQPEGGSARNDKAFQHVSKMMRDMSGGRPAGQRPKVKGKKPPAAGQYGAPASPAQKVAKRRADAQRAQDMMHSRFD